MDKLQNLIVRPGVVFECIASGCAQLLDCNVDGDLVDVQIDLEPGQDHVDLVIANGRYATDSPRYAGLAAATFQSVDVENESLVLRGALFEIEMADPVAVFALLSCSL